MTGRAGGRPDPIEDAVGALAARLPRGAARGRTGLLREAHDGLLDAAAAYVERGCPPAEASRRAVEDFGDLDALAEVYAEDAVHRQARQAGTVLAVGYLLILAAWAVLGQVAPHGLPGEGRSWAASSFAPIGVLAAAVPTALVLVGRRRARHGGTGTGLGWLAGTVGVFCAVATLVASYLVQPWGTRTDELPASVWTGPVELLSAALTFTILALSLRCLRSAWQVRGLRRRRPQERARIPV